MTKADLEALRLVRTGALLALSGGLIGSSVEAQMATAIERVTALIEDEAVRLRLAGQKG